MKSLRGEVDRDGRLVLPAQFARDLGLVPGARPLLEPLENGLQIHRPATQLARVYLEPTSACNLDCVTCMRNAWEEPLGWMAPDMFQRFLDGIGEILPRPLVFLGGYGEPLFHPKTLEMVSAIKELGCAVEMITNGILLDEPRTRALLDAGLDSLWLSLDGATPDSYADVRLGAALPVVLENMARLREMKLSRSSQTPQVGIAFVAMRRNIAQLPEVVRLGMRLGATRFSVSNVIAHTGELRAEALYDRSLAVFDSPTSAVHPLINLPRLDLDGETLEAIKALAGMGVRVTTGGWQAGRSLGRCPFVERGSLSVRWDGQISPCLPLLHSHPGNLGYRDRTVRAFHHANLEDSSLLETWNKPEALTLRERLQEFDFSPCAYCNSCEMADTNIEDCFGSPAPACGGCLWAQGLIQCP